MVIDELVAPFVAEKAAVPLVAQKAQDEAAVVLPNMAFFPEVELLQFQLRYRVDASHFQERQVQALEQAMRVVNGEFLDKKNTQDQQVSWACLQVRKGFYTLAEVPALTFGEESEKVRLYFSAVFAYAKALLIERYPQHYVGNTSNRSAEDPDINAADDYLQESRASVLAAMDLQHCTAELL